MRGRKPLGHALAALLIVAAAPAAAALSPYYQSVAEIQRILADERLNDGMRQEAIVSIMTTARDVYEVKTGSCTKIVTVVDVPRKEGEPIMVGPRQFTLELGEASCR
jgi:hypothetical protein